MLRRRRSEESQRVSRGVIVVGYYDSCLLTLARVFSRWPTTTLSLTLIISIALTWTALATIGLPTLDDPYLGFETRKTRISGRLLTLENFRRGVNSLDPLENYPGERLAERAWKRKKRFTPHNPCTNFPLDEYSRVGLEVSPAQSVFLSTEHVALICYFQKLLEQIPAYHHLCEKGGFDDGGNSCCPMWSLPNYIAAAANKTDCAYIHQDDITRFRMDVDFCKSFYLNRTLGEGCQFRSPECPHICQRGRIIHTAIHHTIDNSYFHLNTTRFSMIILPIAKSATFRAIVDQLQDSIMDLKLPKNSSISLAGLDFGGKDSIFKMYLVRDLRYVVLASGVIFLVVCIYTKSLFVTLVSFSVLSLSLGVTYFLYTTVFNIPYFPFMNMLVTIIVLGIGTDGTLIISVIWQRYKLDAATSQQLRISSDLNNTDNNTSTSNTKELLMFKTLKESTVTLLITTSTTSGAFFASQMSSITTIKCFSIFAGTAIIVSFLLLYISVPTSLILSDNLLDYLKSILFTQSLMEKGGVWIKLVNLYENIMEKVEKVYLSLCCCCFNTTTRNLGSTEKNSSSKLKGLRRSLWIFSFFTCLSIFLLWSSLIVFISPGFQLPNSEQFQLLSSSNPVEKFDQEVEPAFLPWKNSSSGEGDEGGSDLADPITLYFIWGLKSDDNGFALDPNDDGRLILDDNFSMESPESQLWMRNLCHQLRLQSFYDQVANSVVGNEYDSCFLETMVTWMSRDCHQFFSNSSYEPCCKSSTFPYKPQVFSQCIGLAARDVYRTPSLYFKPDIAGPKFRVQFQQNDEKNLNNSNKIDSSKSKSKKLATFSLRVRTNMSFSLSFEKMNTFYKNVDDFFTKLKFNDGGPPKGLENGFFISAHLDFYDLQSSLSNDTGFSFLLSSAICFIFILISSRNLTIAIGALITIFASVVVSSALLIQLFNWKLGVFESIAVTVAVGLSDFTAHHAIEFSKRSSVRGMTSPTLTSALTTLTMGLCMWLMSEVLVYQQIGAFFSILIIVSWIYSVLFLSPILIILGSLANFLLNRCAWTRRNSSSSEVDEVGEVVGYSDDDDDGAEEISVSTVLENRQSVLLEKWKLMKKIAQETSV